MCSIPYFSLHTYRCSDPQNQYNPRTGPPGRSPLENRSREPVPRKARINPRPRAAPPENAFRKTPAAIFRISPPASVPISPARLSLRRLRSLPQLAGPARLLSPPILRAAGGGPARGGLAQKLISSRRRAASPSLGLSAAAALAKTGGRRARVCACRRRLAGAHVRPGPLLPASDTSPFPTSFRVCITRGAKGPRLSRRV